MNSANQRNVSLDVIRIMAMVMVLVLHTFKSFVERPDFFSTPIYFLLLPIVVWSAPAVQVFFILSGYLVLPKPKSLAENWSKTWRRLLVPLAAFELLAVLNVVLVALTDNGVAQSALLAEAERLTRFPNSELWFLYVLAALYVVNPLFFLVFQEGQRRIAQYLTALAFVAPLLLVGLEYPVGRFDQTYVNVTSWLWCLFFYLYGGLLAKGWAVSAKPLGRLSVIGVSMMALMSTNYLLARESVGLIVLSDVLHWFLHILGQLLVAVLAIGFFQSVLTIRWEKWQSVVIPIALLSFGVYLIHPLLIDPVLRYWLNWHFDAVGLHPILYNLLNFLIVLFGSLGVSFAIYKTPWLRMILGEKPRP